jgi:hypothetical protein
MSERKGSWGAKSWLGVAVGTTVGLVLLPLALLVQFPLWLSVFRVRNEHLKKWLHM